MATLTPVEKDLLHSCQRKPENKPKQSKTFMFRKNGQRPLYPAHRPREKKSARFSSSYAMVRDSAVLSNLEVFMIKQHRCHSKNCL